jgi:ankyrin repeat protein
VDLQRLRVKSVFSAFRMSLLCLPREFIHMVVSELTCGRDLLNLICTNRLLHDLLILDLYKWAVEKDPLCYALVWCAVKGSMKGMERLYHFGVNLNRPLNGEVDPLKAKNYPQSTSALFEAVRNDQCLMVIWLLNHGADVNKSYFRHDSKVHSMCSTTPLFHAADESNLVMASLLLSFGADVGFSGGSVDLDDETITPLDVAAGRGDCAMTLMLLQSGAKITDLTLSRAVSHAGDLAWMKSDYTLASDTRLEAVETAPDCNYQDVVKALYLWGADVNDTGILRFAASYHGSLKDGIIELLLDLGADLNSKDHLRESVLFWVFGDSQYRSYQRSKDFVDFFMSRGAIFDPQEMGYALRYLIYGNEREVFDLLLEYGADVNVPNRDDGMTPLHDAIVVLDRETKESFVKSLLSRGADVLLRDHTSKTALEYAILMPWDTEMVILLLDSGGKAHCQGKQGAKMLNMILMEPFGGKDRWIDPNGHELQGWLEELDKDPDALFLSVNVQHNRMSMDRMISLLLEYGVRADCVDESGQCPLDLPIAGLIPVLRPLVLERRERDAALS